MENNINNTEDKKLISTKIDTSYSTPSNIKYSINYKLIAVTAMLLIIIGLGLSYFLIFRKDVVVTPPPNTSTFPNINSSSTGNSSYYEETSDEEESFAESEYSELLHIWPLAVAGYSIHKQTSSSTTAPSTKVLFFDSASGNMYKSEGPDFKAERLSGENIDNILKSSFSHGLAHAAYLDNKYNLYVVDTPQSDTNFLEKTLVSENVYDFSFSKSENKIAYLKKERNNSSLNIYNFDTKENTIIYSTPLSDLNIEWLLPDTVLVKSKVSNLAEQTIIQINIKTLKFDILTSNHVSNKILPDYKNIYFDGVNLYFQDSVRSVNKIKTNIISIPDKCNYINITLICAESLISNIYSLPDEWYKGNISFIDYLTLYNIRDASYTRYDLSVIAGESIDYYKPISNLENIAFMNKRDMSLWLLDTSKIIN